MSLRFSIARLTAAIALCGVALAALRSASEWWSSLVFSATLLVLAVATAYAAQRRAAYDLYQVLWVF